MYIDTHCHIDDPKFNDIDEVIADCKEKGVDVILTMGCDAPTSVLCRDLAEKYDRVYFAAGFHPEDADGFSEDGFNTVRSLLSHRKCVAVGEVGLDYYYDGYDRGKQIEVFEKQIILAGETGLPLSIHSREATKDTMDILSAHKNDLKSGFSMHCFSGSVETEKEILDLGGYIGFGGTVTFKNSRKAVEAAKYCPIYRMLTETDCPYLAPEGKRGQRNTPANIPIIAEFLADLKGLPVREFAERVLKNGKDLFKKLPK